jgi:hypothetical protein
VTQYPDHVAIARKLLDQQGEINALTERAEKAEGELAELNHAITWETTCLNCSRLLTRSYEDYCRADTLAAAVLAVSNELTQSGSHDAAGRLGDALDRHQETAGNAPAFPLAIRPDGTHAYTSTYCAHGDHGACRLTCKTCSAGCGCSCHATETDPK